MAALKLSELHGVLDEFASTLEANKADRLAVRSLRDFCAALVGHEDLTVTAFLKAARRAQPTPNASAGSSISSLRHALASLQPLVARLKKKDLKNSLDSILDALSDQTEQSVVAFVTAVTKELVPASKGKDAAPMDNYLVDDYVTRLESALGDDKQFTALMVELTADRRVEQSEAVAIATRFYGQTSSGTSRSKALARIRERHAKLMKFKRQPSTAGRSAA